MLTVPPHEAGRAADALSAYESENPEGESHRGREPPARGNTLAGLAVSGALLVFFSITGPRRPVIWFERGSADAERILQGELWRAVTALTLHADLPHVLANALASALFLSAVCGALGTGVGCALVLLAGAGGNLVNALVQGSDHVSVGASTAVFGAVGLLSGLGASRRRRRRQGGPPWVPAAAGLAILAMLGTAGERVDLWAHLFGLLVGAALGVAAGAVLPRPPGLLVQWVFGGVALTTTFWCWALAWG